MMLAIAPFELSSPIVSVLLGMAFGFTLESSGFGDARRLAAQFYFRESRVVKVMFTAIVVCMLLLLWSSALGFLDFQRIWVNPTYLASGILGGFVLGVGFIVGGYCPGTSIVSTATLKKDGALFLGGVGLGAWIFSETAPAFRTWYDTAGYLGRVTLPEWLGLPAGVVAVLIVLMAIGMFFFFDQLEQTIGRRSARGGAKPAPAPRWVGWWKPAVKGGGLALAAFLLLAMALPAVGQPDLTSRLERLAPELEKTKASRSVHIDPAELLGLMHNHVQGKPGRFGLVLIDVRDESDYNLFHLVDATRHDLEALAAESGRALAGETYADAIKVVMSNDEHDADTAWALLRAQGVGDVYVLAGGVNGWLDLWRDDEVDADPAANAAGDDTLRHEFPEALGTRYEYAKPAITTWKRLVDGGRRAFEWKVKPVVKAPAATGGCG